MYVSFSDRPASCWGFVTLPFCSSCLSLLSSWSYVFMYVCLREYVCIYVHICIQRWYVCMCENVACIYVELYMYVWIYMFNLWCVCFKLLLKGSGIFNDNSVFILKLHHLFIHDFFYWSSFMSCKFICHLWWLIMQEGAIHLLCTIINFYPSSVQHHYETVSPCLFLVRFQLCCLFIKLYNLLA